MLRRHTAPEWATASRAHTSIALKPAHPGIHRPAAHIRARLCTRHAHVAIVSGSTESGPDRRDRHAPRSKRGRHGGHGALGLRRVVGGALPPRCARGEGVGRWEVGDALGAMLAVCTPAVGGVGTGDCPGRCARHAAGVAPTPGRGSAAGTPHRVRGEERTADEAQEPAVLTSRCRRNK